MGKYFFTYWDELPPDIGFSVFGREHLIWLGICAAAIIVLTIWDSTHQKQKQVDRFIGWFLVGAILVRMCYLLLIGKQTVYELPLHLCSLAGFLCLLHAYRKWEWLEQSLYSLCLPGTVFALLFPDWTGYPPIHFITIEGFLFHAGIVLYVVLQLANGLIRPALRKIWKAFLFLAIAAAAVWVFDKRFDANYMFLNWPPPDSPLSWLASFMGNPGYLAGYALLVIAVPILMDIFYQIWMKLKKP